MQKIPKNSLQQILSIPYHNLSSERKIEEQFLPVFTLDVQSLPDGIDAIICTSDLQGTRFLDSKKNIDLLGIHLAKELADFLNLSKEIDIKKTGILLAGDFFCQPDLKGRGGRGFVDDIWYSFASKFRWVSGVAGNHDEFKPNFFIHPKDNIYFLDKTYVEVDNIKIGGISGIISNSNKKSYRYTLENFIIEIRQLLQMKLDIFVMHQNPDFFNLNNVLSSLPDFKKCPQIIIHGHKPTNEIISETTDGIPCINVHEKIIILNKQITL